MNKFAKFFVVFAMALCLMAVPAFAATSMSGIGEITEAVDENGDDVEITVVEGDDPILTEVIAAAEIGNGCQASELKVLWQKNLSADTLPVSITFNAAGTEGLPLYVFHWNGAKWDLIAEGTGENVTATFDSLSPVGLVVRHPQTNNNGNTSDKTGTTNTSAIALGIAMVAGAAAVVTYRKKAND